MVLSALGQSHPRVYGVSVMLQVVLQFWQTVNWSVHVITQSCQEWVLSTRCLIPPLTPPHHLLLTNADIYITILAVTA